MLKIGFNKTVYPLMFEIIMLSDEKIENHIKEQIAKDNRVDATRIKVKVQDNNVILEGQVPTFRDKKAAEENAWLIEGTKAVENNLTVEYYTPPQLPNDAEIKNRLEKSLFWSSEIDSENVLIDVQNGWVTFQGNVPTLYEKAKVEEYAFGLRGVLGITNELAVVPTEEISDEIIAENITDSITRNKNVSIDDISIKVKEGMIELYGTVKSKRAKTAAADSALYTSGVKAIKNNIVVK
jgi:osmotically-inducible protein OsmY